MRQLTYLLAAAFFLASPVLAEKIGTETVKLAKYEEQTPFQMERGEMTLDLKEKHEYYDISGVTLDELRGQMKKNGTKWGDNQTYAALTTWDIKYDYKVSENDGRYSIASVKTKADITYHYPRVVNSAGMPEDVAGHWNSYMYSLVVHEVGHKDIAVKAATDINEALSSIGHFDSKRELKKAVNLAVEEIFKNLRENQVKYDDDTHHGVTQGAVLG